jgi:tRNA dimethylallyltransferase
MRRPFRIIKIGLQLPREELYQRINNRVDQMMQQGLLEEAQRVFPQKDYNSLNTVGYKELFNYFEGKWTLEEAVEKIKRNTRIYARKQMMWFNNDSSIVWFRPNKTDEILHFVSDISSS